MRRKVIIIIGAVALGFWISSRFPGHNSSQPGGAQEDSASCTAPKIAVDKLQARAQGHGYYRITGRITNNCDQPVSVQVTVAIYDKADNILAVPFFWPAGVNNIPAHTEYPFEWLDDSPGFHHFTVSITSVATR